MTEQAIRLRDIKKMYKQRCVLDIPELELSPSRRYALIGANGAGKSTLLRLLAGALELTDGEIEYPQPLQQTGAVAYLPQKPYAFSFSVLRNLTMAFPADCSLSAAEKTEAARNLLARVGLSDFEQMKGNRLSGGESQRLAFARLLVAPHKLLLLDEPTSATDIEGNDLIESTLRQYLNQQNASLIFATHSPSQALRLADSVILLEGGRVIEQGDASQVIEHPRSPGGQRFLRYWKG